MAYEGYESSRGWTEDTFGTFTATQNAYFEAELAALKIEKTSSLRLLDIGFGNGAFLGWCRSKGWRCDGLELNERLLRRAADHGYSVGADLKSLKGEGGAASYDVITGFDVLEHIDRAVLVRFVAALGTISTPRTLLLFRFPNGDNPFSLPLQNGDVTHLTAIGQLMLRQVAALAGFEVIQLRSPCQSSAGEGVRRRVLQAVGLPVRWAVGTCIRHLFMGGLPVIYSPNLVAVLRVPATGGVIGNS